MSLDAENQFDVFIIGGGINGSGIARDAVGRGFSVCLCESGDLGGGTSSASTKLIHGGLRYLEHYEFRLVRESLMEREIIWNMAPHIVRPIRIVLPHHQGLRPKWLLRLGLFFYDHMGGRKLLPASIRLNLQQHEAGKSLKSKFTTAFEFSDCWVEDSRLVVLTAKDAENRGATIQTHTKVLNAVRTGDLWNITTQDSLTGELRKISARTIINAAGPWVDEVLRTVLGNNRAQNVRLVRGSHIVIKKKFQHDKSYMFQNADDRIIFAIPYEDKYTLIGTTDAEHASIDERPTITPEEIEYLCDMASEYFEEPVAKDDIVWSYSGVRPLYDDGASAAQEATRDYVLQKEGENGEPKLFNIFGGKITTYRRLAEAMMIEIEAVLGKNGEPWTKNTHLPGGDFVAVEIEKERAKLKQKFPFLEEEYIARLTRNYGTLAETVLEGATKIQDLGICFGADLYQQEVEYLIDQEWAQSAEDILFRRTKLGINFDENQTRSLSQFMDKMLQIRVRTD